MSLTTTTFVCFFFFFFFQNFVWDEFLSPREKFLKSKKISKRNRGNRKTRYHFSQTYADTLDNYEYDSEFETSMKNLCLTTSPSNHSVSSFTFTSFLNEGLSSLIAEKSKKEIFQDLLPENFESVVNPDDSLSQLRCLSKSFKQGETFVPRGMPDHVLWATKTWKREEDEFKPLTRKQLERIQQATTGNEYRQVHDQKLFEDYNLELTVHDLRSLKRGQWLNDEVMNAYFMLIKARGVDKNGVRKVWTFNSFFYNLLKKHGYKKVRRWT